MRRLTALVALAAALVVVPLGAARADAPPKTVLHLGEDAPGFFLPVVDAKAAGLNRVVLSNWFEPGQSKAVVISFFATWCHPCKKELPLLQKLYEKYKAQGLKVVVVSIDRDPKAVASLPEFLSQRGLTFPVVSDRFNLLARRYLGTSSALPSLFIADGSGKLVLIRQGYSQGAEAFLEAALRKALGLGPLAADAAAVAKGGKGPAAAKARK
jgi:thiol-disulfide isomerase/thioredoxin